MNFISIPLKKMRDRRSLPSWKARIGVAWFALCASMPAFAMRLLDDWELAYLAQRNNRVAPNADEQRTEPGKHYLPIPDRLYLPLTLDQPITDELIEKLSPTWIQNKDFLHQNAKNQLLQDVLNINGGLSNANWPLRRKEIIRAIYFGANPELIGLQGETCLHGATLFSDYHLAEYLLSKGANPNAKDSAEETPIHACRTVQLANLLMEHGAYVSQALLYGCCVPYCPSDLMQLYLDKGIHKKLEIDSYIMLIRMNASHHENQLKKIVMLIQAGIDVNAKSPKGNTALMHAAYVSSIKFAELLLRAKANVNTQNNTGQTALMNACIAQSEPLCKLLLVNGANICTTNSEGRTAIHIAAALKNEQLCRILLNHQMHINAEIKATLHCLWRLKNSSLMRYNETYRNFKAQLLPHFRPYTNLSKLLDQRNYENQRPFDYLPIECLNPEKYKPVELK